MLNFTYNSFFSLCPKNQVKVNSEKTGVYRGEREKHEEDIDKGQGMQLI